MPKKIDIVPIDKEAIFRKAAGHAPPKEKSYIAPSKPRLKKPTVE